MVKNPRQTTFRPQVNPCSTSPLSGLRPTPGFRLETHEGHGKWGVALKPARDVGGETSILKHTSAGNTKSTESDSFEFLPAQCLVSLLHLRITP